MEDVVSFGMVEEVVVDVKFHYLLLNKLNRFPIKRIKIDFITNW